MTRIALAGGTGSLGLTFLSALSASPAKHHIHVLTRSPPPPKPPITGPQISYHQVSYSSPDPLAAFLTANAITLVISAISIESTETSAAQQTLIAAAALSPSVTHIIPSEYGFPCSAALLAIAPPWEHWAANAAVLAAIPAADLRFVRLQTGWFMDYFGMPHVDTRLTPFPWAVDAARMVAALPGTGTERVSMTYTGDLARYVAWLAENLGQWPEDDEVFLVEDDVALSEVVACVERARGREFEIVVFDGEEKLLRGEVTWFEGQEKPSHAHWFSMFGLMACRGLMALPREGRVNTAALGWDMVKVKDLVEKAWKGR